MKLYCVLLEGQACNTVSIVIFYLTTDCGLQSLHCIKSFARGAQHEEGVLWLYGMIEWNKILKIVSMRIGRYS